MQVARALLLEAGSGSPSTAERILREHNIATTRVASLDEARKQMEPGGFDLWIVALTGADDPAWDLIDASRTQLPEGTCLLVMGDDSAGAFERALGAGAYGYVLQPLREVELRQSLRQCIDRIHLYRENQSLKREATLFQMIKNIALAMELDTLLEMIMDAALTLTGGAAGSVLLRDEETGQLVPGAVRGIEDEAPRAPFFNLSPEYLAGLLRGGAAIQLTPQSPDIRRMRLMEEQVESALIAPFVAAGLSVGLVTVVRTSPPPFDAGSLRVLARLAEETSAAVTNALSVHKTRELVIKDDLTQAFNRRYFETYLEEELQRSKRYGANMSLIFLDLDNLKEINNRHGHFVGSKVLQEVAYRIILTVRGIDKVIRYGGDEFCVILPETEIEGANRVAERIRQNVAQAPFLTQEGLDLAMTVSIGIAACPTHARTKEELVKKADLAMFKSKAGAKNIVTVASV